MLLKCKMCGGDLQPAEGMNTVECEFCGTMQTIATPDSEKKTNLFNRANRLRMASEFDKAAAVYEGIVAEFPQEAEAYWGLCLCAYGIEYVDDPATGRKIPTCHRTLPESIMDCSNFEMACDYADGVARKLYRSEAKEIDRLQKEILAVVVNEAPYDVFICYKETDEAGNRTEDSVLAQDIYDALTAKDMKVFFARITLEDKLGQQYEPYIYAALHSAKVMLAIGTSYEYYDAVWVKNEWSRYLGMASKDKSKNLIPCYKNIDAYDIPKEFRNLQALDMNKLGWLQDLVRGVVKLTETEAPSAQVHQKKNQLSNYVQMAENALAVANYAEAEAYCNKILEEDYNHAEAWRIKGMTIINFTNRIFESENCLQKYYSLFKGNKDECAQMIISAMDNYFRIMTSNALSNMSAEDTVQWNACITLLTNAEKVYQNIGSYTGKESDVMLWMIQQMENRASNIWESQIKPYVQRNNGYPSEQDFNSFLRVYERPILFMEQLVGATSIDPNGNLRRLKLMRQWTEYAMTRKSWHFETEDEMFDRLGMGYEARQGINRTINLKLYSRQWIADYEMSSAACSIWKGKFTTWDRLVPRFEADAKKLAQKRQAEAEQRIREQQMRVEEYWRQHTEEKVQLEQKLEGLNAQAKPLEEKAAAVRREIAESCQNIRVPLEEESERLKKEIRILEEERDKLGLLAIKRKKEINEKIQWLTGQLPSRIKIFDQREAMQNEISGELRKKLSDYQREMDVLAKQIADIREELSKPRGMPK